MDKQELIERIEDFPCEASLVTEMIRINKNTLLGWVKELNEPEEPVVPQFVVEWINSVKKHGKKQKNSFGFYEEITADDSVYRVMYYIFKEDFATDAVRDWVINNKDTFARAWLDGYEVEKEKRYLVKMKGVDSRTNYLYYGLGSKTWLFKTKLIDGNFRKSHTRKELEEAGFEEVFNSPLFEVEEVE